MTTNVSALGRVAEIGDFYDAVNDAFIPCNLFNQKIAADCLTLKDVHSVNTGFYFTNTKEEKLRIWDVKGDVSLSLASGILKLFSGSATYLNEKRESSRSLHCVFCHHEEHELERLNTSYEELVNKVAVSGIATGATHVVVGILKGCNAFVEVSCDVEGNVSGGIAKGQIEMGFPKFNGDWKQVWDSIWKKGSQSSTDDSGDGSVIPSTSSGDQKDHKTNFLEIGRKNSCELEVTNVRLKLFADAHLEGELTPTTLEEAKETIRRTVESVRRSKSSVPLVYTLLDVKEISRIFHVQHPKDHFYAPMSESLIKRFKNLLASSEEDVLKISEFAADLKEYGRFLTPERLNTVIAKKQEVEGMDMDLQHEIATLATKLRSSERSEEQILELGEKLVLLTSRLSSSDVDKFLKENRDLERFTKFVGKLRSLNVTFINTMDEFRDMEPTETYILIFSLEDVSKGEALWEKTRLCFLDLCLQEEAVCAVVIRHLVTEIKEFAPEEFGPKIIITKNGACQTKDFLANLESIAKFNMVTPTEDHLPPEKNALSLVCAKLPCPNPLCSASNEKEWYCICCCKVLEYDREDHFYCRCGQLPVEKFLFKCKDEKHGTVGLPYDISKLKEHLRSHRAYENINLLFIGETGTGKTTLINSIPTYLSFDSFEEAQQQDDLKVLIDFQISRSVPRETLVETKTLKFRSNESDVYGQVIPLESNEVLVLGQSSTKMPRSHYFKHDETIYHIIDTPGIGDTRGTEQDKENVQNIVNYVCNLEKIHLICFIFPADTPRITERFLYCFKQLIMQFHKSAIGNIAFCITKAGINFQMGNTSVCLQKVVDDIQEAQDIIIPLNQDNIFIFDNTGWLDMAAATQGIEQENVDLSRKSFVLSRIAVLRLMRRASSCQPHNTNDTKQIHMARSTIQRLSKHLTVIGENVHKTVSEMQLRKQMVERFKGDEKELLKILKKKVKIYRGHIRGGISVLCEECERKLKTESNLHMSISYTRTSVFIAAAFVAPFNFPVSLAVMLGCGVVLARPADILLHKTMDLKCDVPSCRKSAKLKTFIRRYVVEEEKEEIDVAVQQNLLSFQSREQEVELRIKADEQFLKEIEDEKSSINKALAKFAHFLKKHGIVAYNDITEEYLNVAIDVEKNERGRSEKCEMLSRMKDEYAGEKKVYLELESNEVTEITAESVLAVVEELKKLKHYGRDIEEAFKEVNEQNIEVHGTVYDPKGQLPFMARIGAFLKNKLPYGSR